MKNQSIKRRREIRHQLREPLPARVLLRRLRDGGSRGVSGLLMDVSKNGLGVLVQEHVALDSRCRIEVVCNQKRQVFRGEVCYGTRTEAGLRLGILLSPSNTLSALEYLRAEQVELV